MIRDELTALVNSLNQYKAGKGADLQFYLSAWAGTAIPIDRKNLPVPIYVRNPHLCIVGGLPPDLLPHLRGDRLIKDGFIDRFLLSFPDAEPAAGENWDTISPDLLQNWKDVLNQLFDLTQLDDDQGGQAPDLIEFTDCGADEWAKFTNDLAKQINNPDLPAHLRNPWAKMHAYGARLALVVHLLRWASDETDSEDVTGESMARAAVLVSYFQSHAAKAYHCMDADPNQDQARKLLRWIIHKAPSPFSKRDAQQANRGQFPNADDIDRPLALLAKYNWILEEPAPDKQGPGRKPSRKFHRHPDAAAQFTQNTQNGAGGFNSEYCE
jgi:hypothetical protein